MFRSRIVPIATAAVIALGGGGLALAAGSGQPAAAVSQPSTAPAAAASPLVRAVTAAEQSTGGHAMKVTLEHEKAKDQYEVRVATKDKLLVAFVDAATGKVTRTEDEGLIAKIFEHEDRDEIKALAASPTTLAAAITAAEQETGGKATRAAFENEDGKVQFEVRIRKGNVARTVLVDGRTGKATKVSRGEEHEGHED